MTMFAQPMRSSGSVDEELLALAKLEATSNAIRLRIAGLAPDQLYRGTGDELTISELMANAVERERAYLDAFRRVQSQTNPRLVEPQPGLSFMDRDFADDIAMFFDLRRMTLDILRSYNDHDWTKHVTLPNGSTITLEELAVRLQHHDALMLSNISAHRARSLKLSGVDELRDMGVAGKLGQNIAQ